MNNYKKREIFNDIVNFLEIPETLVLHGARQVGKTTLMKMVIDYIEKKGQNKTFYFDLEDEKYLKLCNQGCEEIVKYIKGVTGQKNNNKIFIFIDEIQYLDNPSSLLKLFYDHYKDNYKLIVSGSSSFAIKSKFKDSLVGRIVDLEIFGLSFQEFLNFKGLKYDLTTNSNLANEELKKIYKEYILYGFYPQVALTDKLEMKEIYLNGIIEKYIYKDIKDLAKIRNVEKFNNLLECLASQSGQLVNVNELSNTLDMSRQTIEEFLFILENTYIIKLVRPFYKNIRGELTKMSKVFFEDLGILNILKNKKLSTEFDGAFFENSIYNYLRREFNSKDIHFWRTKSKQEVDFVINSKEPIPFEVKMAYADNLMKNLIYFGENYQVNNLYCVTNTKKEALRYKNIKQIYPWEIKNTK